MNEEEIKFYSIGRGNLNIDGKFYYGLDYTITDFMRSLEQERNNYKELYEKEKEKREALKHILIGKFNSTQDTIYLDILTDIMQPLEKGNENDK